MKLSNRVFAVLLCCSQLVVSQEWITTKLANTVSIQFPVESSINNSHKDLAHVAEDETGFYIVIVKEMTDRENTVLVAEALPDYYRDIAMGKIDTAAGTLHIIEDVTMNGMPALDVSYEAGPYSAIPGMRLSRLIYVNKQLFTIDFGQRVSLIMSLMQHETGLSIRLI